MNREKLSSAIGDVNEKYVEEAVVYTARNKKITKWLSIAASFVLIIAAGIFSVSYFRSPDSRSDNLELHFIVSATDVNGEMTELNEEEGFFNSGTSQSNIFNVHMPLFSFSVSPSTWKEGDDRVISFRYSISVSYNGITADTNDEHIAVLCEIPIDSDAPWSFAICGWFTKPTDLIITITDKETDEIVDVITVNVKYIAEREEYELKLVDLNELYSEQKAAADASETLENYFSDYGSYPEWYGGCYIEENMLHVKLVSPTEKDIEKISDILAAHKDCVVYEDGENPITELQKYADDLTGELLSLGYNITHWYVDPISGNIIIGVLEIDFETLSELISKKYSEDGMPNVTVEKGNFIALD